MSDQRSYRIAVLSTATFDAPSSAPGSAAAELAHALEQEGWGLVQLPPPGLRGPALDRATSIVLDQLQDWAANAYRVVIFRVRGEAAGEIELFISACERRQIRADPIPTDLPGVESAFQVLADPASPGR